MTYRVTLTDEAKSQRDRLSDSERAKLARGVAALAKNPRVPGVTHPFPDGATWWTWVATRLYIEYVISDQVVEVILVRVLGNEGLTLLGE